MTNNYHLKLYKPLKFLNSNQFEKAFRPLPLQKKYKRRYSPALPGHNVETKLNRLPHLKNLHEFFSCKGTAKSIGILKRSENFEKRLYFCFKDAQI